MPNIMVKDKIYIRMQVKSSKSLGIYKSKYA